MQYTIPLEGQWVTFDTAKLRYLRDHGQEDIAEMLADRVIEYEKNRASFFLPHGEPWRAKEKVLDIGSTELVLPASNYPKDWLNDGAAFQNDWEHEVSMLIAPNQTGKSFAGAFWSINRIIPMDPNWEVFTKHNVEYHEWSGPKIWVAASYSWDNVTTLWKRYRELLPRHELLNYSYAWGKFDGERGRQKDLSFGSRTSASTLHLACGSVIKFLCYTQMQMHWEGFECDGAQFDEQPEEEQWVGWNRGCTTRGDYTPCSFTLTGHVMEDRANTGAAGWVKRKFWDGTETKGKTIARYRLSVESTPDTVITPKRKKDLWVQWADPEVQRDDKQNRAAVARYWGGWEEGSGLWIDIWNHRYHVVAPLWKDDATPNDWTKWRVIDFGDNGITCCLWIALGPKGYAFVYREMYERGMTIAGTCRQICEMSGSTQVEMGTSHDPETGNLYQIFEERPGREKYYSTILDSRSCAQRQQGETLAGIFQRYGIEVIPACGQKNSIQIPRMKEWLRLDFTKEHLSLRDKNGERCMGNAWLMVFEHCRNLIDEMESCQRHKDDPSKIAPKQPNHALDVVKYWASSGPSYMGNNWMDDDVNDVEHIIQEQSGRTKYTGY